jgi:serine/threonine protein kinase
VSDFGLAINSEWSSEFGCGSVRYESPECLSSKSPRYPTKKSDVWSLGVILINMLAGQNPWCEPSMADEMYREYVQEPGFFERHFTNDNELVEILEGCLDRDADTRWGIEKLCQGIDGLIGSPDSAVEFDFTGAFRERKNSWASEAMDWDEVPVFPSVVELTEVPVFPSAVELNEIETKTMIEEEEEKGGMDDADKLEQRHRLVEHDESKKEKRRKRRHRKYKKIRLNDVDGSEGLMIKMAAAFSKSVETLETGFRMTFL